MMNVSTLFTTVVLGVIAILQPINAQFLPPTMQYMVNNGAQGTEFWIAVPPNELLPFPTDALEIYVTSAYDTEVTVFDAASGRTYKRTVKAGAIRTLSDKRGETDWAWEIRTYEQPVKQGVRLTADKPITVSVLNSKVTTSDGYLALPVSNWDTNYVVTTYYDFRESRSWAGGFVVIAKEPTVVTIELRGRGQGSAKTSGGKDLFGPPFQVALDAGEVYSVIGDAGTRGIFDLTGTSITSNVPVGVISFHQRTTMPNLLTNGNGRNHLVEMNIPTSQWANTYATVQFGRVDAPWDRGDMMRIVAAEANTTWQMTSYDRITGAILRQEGGTINNAGGFAEIAQVSSPTDLVRGVSVWTANKPVQVVQYSCSSTFDGSTVGDPFQINLLPVERYVQATVFQVPTDGKFSKHLLNLVIEADTSDPDLEDQLKAITLDDAPLWTNQFFEGPALLNSRVPGTNLYVVRVAVDATAHTVVSPELPFGGYIYGYGAVDAYGWPLGPTHLNDVASDTMPPQCSAKPLTTTSWTAAASERFNIPAQVRPRPLRTDQVDAGIAEIGLVPGATNLAITVTRQPGTSRKTADTAAFSVWVIDPSQPASGSAYVLDYAGNYSTTNHSYVPKPALTSTTRELNFGRVRVRAEKELALDVRNPSSAPITLDSVTSTLPIFSVKGLTTPVNIGVASNLDLSVRCAPLAIGEQVDTLHLWYADTVLSIPLLATAVEPVLAVDPVVDLGVTGPNQRICSAGTFLIKNTGTDVLTITKVRKADEGVSFEVDTNACPLPIVVESGGTYDLACICFQAENRGGYSARIELTADHRDDPYVVDVVASVDPALSVDERPLETDVTVTVGQGAANLIWDQEVTPSSWTLFDLRGTIIASGRISSGARECTIGTTSIPRGTYVLSVDTSHGVWRQVLPLLD